MTYRRWTESLTAPGSEGRSHAGGCRLEEHDGGDSEFLAWEAPLLVNRSCSGLVGTW